jgi:protein-arginine deiminase
MSLVIVLSVILWPGICSGPDIDLDGDTDRDGVISGSQAEEDLEAKNSVLVINNCDRDGTATSATKGPLPDNADEMINGAKDREDLEPLVIRKLGQPVAGRVSLRLKAQSKDEIDEKQRVRIFKDDGTMIIGPSTSTTYVLSDAEQLALTTADLKLLVEGLAFATSVKLSLYLDETEKDYLILEMAPFLLVPHTRPVEKNFVVKTNTYCPLESAQYVDAFRSACDNAGVTSVTLNSDDVWIEDEMSWGYSQTPRVLMPVALHLYRLHELRSIVRAFLGPDVGYATAFDYGCDPPLPLGPGQGPNSINFGGNIEVTPQTKKYPFGRVYYGSIPSPADAGGTVVPRGIDPRYRRFFERQKVQPPIDLNTDWLLVGHVDEIISFVPKSDGGFVLLLASPTRGLEIAGQLGTETILPERYRLWFGDAATVGDVLGQPQAQESFTQYNEDLDFKIFGYIHADPDSDSIKGRLKSALCLDEGDILEVPVLFGYISSDSYKGAIALNPGMVNLNSMSLYSLLPEPFLAAFKAPVQLLCSGIGQQPLWIDDWYIYHIRIGEVHCGSNSRRAPFTAKWWEAQPGCP